MSSRRPVTARRRSGRSAAAVPEGRLRLRRFTLAFALGAAVTGAGWVVIGTLPGEAAKAGAGAEGAGLRGRSLAEVRAAAPGELAGMDIAEMNLLCARGCHGVRRHDAALASGHPSEANGRPRAADDPKRRHSRRTPHGAPSRRRGEALWHVETRLTGLPLGRGRGHARRSARARPCGVAWPSVRW